MQETSIAKKAFGSATEDRKNRMKTRASNAAKVNYYPTGMTLTKGRRIANQRRSERLAEKRRQKERHLRHLSEGISPGEFQKLPNLRVTAGNTRTLRDKSCVICQAPFRVGQSLTLGIPCSHPLHSKCSELWMKQVPTCPMCRACQPCELKKR